MSQLKTAMSTPIDALIAAIARRPTVPMTSICAVCGLDDTPASYALLLAPDERDATYPFFPNLVVKSKQASNKEVTACTFCYHSLVSQWILMVSTVDGTHRFPWGDQLL